MEVVAADDFVTNVEGSILEFGRTRKISDNDVGAEPMKRSFLTPRKYT